MPEEIKAVESGEVKLRKTADAMRARKRASAEPDRPSHEPATPLSNNMLFRTLDPTIFGVTRDLIMQCGGPNIGWRTLDTMSSTTMRAKSEIKEALQRLGDAVKARAGDLDDEYLIEGERSELLARAKLTRAQPYPSAVDRSDEVSSLRAENNELRTQLADANDEIDRLKRLLHEKVIEKIAAKLAADGETKPTVNDVVTAALG
jgi:hypothetical protein